jgi:uncharacterized protein (DUF58 family)
MWKHFLTSISLLSIAMVAALYSSSATRDGRMIASAIAALISLSIAIWVGVRFVPRLAAGVDWEWLPFFSRYRVTREGWIYFGALVIVLFAAINTNNNLLYMVLSALLAVMLLSGFLSGLNFRFLRAEVRCPSRCFAGEAFPISIQVHNDKKVFPSFSLKVAPPKDGPLSFRTFYFPLIRPNSREGQIREATIAQRGRYRLEELRIGSRYPFGFVFKDKKYRLEAECVCYPRIIPQDELNFSVLDIQGTNQRFERGLGNDLYLIRNYVPSDSARHVHWKASAKTALLKTREYAAEESRRVILAFDRYGHADEAETFERLVSQTASLAFHLIGGGVEVSLVSDEWETGYGTSEVLLESILEYLALVQFSETAGRPNVSLMEGALSLSLR